MTVQSPAYTDIPDRVRGQAETVQARLQGVIRAVAAEPAGEPPEKSPPTPNSDGDTELLGDVVATHRFLDAPGDGETVRWHFVEAGPVDAPVVVFLHGLPDSWWQWHHAIAELGPSFRCIALDLKGYGQSDKKTGDYRQEGVAGQIIAVLDLLGVDTFSLVTHDRGTVVADYLVAQLGTRVRRYARGQQHLWHLHPDLYPQEALFTSPVAQTILSDARGFVTNMYTLSTKHAVDEADLSRTVDEFSFPGVAGAVPRYFNASSFRQEWLERRNRLIPLWRCPVLLIQGTGDPMQPQEFYTDPDVVAQLPPGSALHLLDAGHFWPSEAPAEACRVLSEFLTEE